VSLALALQVTVIAPAAADSWTDKVDAVSKLWNARQRPAGAGQWPVTSCDNWAGLPAEVQAVASNTTSGLVVPKVKVTESRLTDSVRSIARALLAINLDDTASAGFLPNDPGADRKITYNVQFWAQRVRTTHADTNNRLPAPVIGALQDPPQYCPATLVANMTKLAVLEALRDAPVSANRTNKVRWHCYANQFRTVGINDLGIKGFVEMSHFEFNSKAAPAQYPNPGDSARYIFDYTQKRVYFTPTHYERWSKTDWSQVADNAAPAANTTCNPFFELVP
jgi:lysophospholipase L1-like esterase